MTATKRELQHSLPFAMEPVVYDFAINDRGTVAELLGGPDALLPAAYYALQVPHWLRQDPRTLTAQRRAELDRLGGATRSRPEMAGMAETLFDRLLPARAKAEGGPNNLQALLQTNGFDPEQHERIRSGLRRGLIGLAQNRLPATSVIEDVRPGDVLDAGNGLDARLARLGRDALAAGAVGVVTLAAGAGSRWTQGAGVVKALHPFCKLGGRHRTFLELHLAKSRRVSREFGSFLPHVVTTGYLTHGPIEAHLLARSNYGYPGPRVRLSPRSCGSGLRLVPITSATICGFAWGGDAATWLCSDEQAQKVRDSRACRGCSTGRGGPAKVPTTPTTCLCNVCIRSATGTKSPTCSATACCATCSPSGPACAT